MDLKKKNIIILKHLKKWEDGKKAHNKVYKSLGNK